MNFRTSYLAGLLVIIFSLITPVHSATKFKVIGPNGEHKIENSQYGPTSIKDTFWSIANKVRPNQQITIYQVMAALYDANPHAFATTNYNSLEAGMFLVIPPVENMLSIPKAVAKNRATQNDKKWDKRQVKVVKPKSTPPTLTSQIDTQPEVKSGVSDQSQEKIEELIGLLEDEKSKTLSLTDELSRSQDELRITQEDLQSLKAELDKLNDNMATLEERLLVSKQKNAALQANNADLEDQIAAAKVEQPTETWTKLLDNTWVVVAAASVPALLIILIAILLFRRKSEAESEPQQETVTETSSEPVEDSVIDIDLDPESPDPIDDELAIHLDDDPQEQLVDDVIESNESEHDDSNALDALWADALDEQIDGREIGEDTEELLNRLEQNQEEAQVEPELSDLDDLALDSEELEATPEPSISEAESIDESVMTDDVSAEELSDQELDEIQDKIIDEFFEQQDIDSKLDNVLESEAEDSGFDIELTELDSSEIDEDILNIEQDIDAVQPETLEPEVDEINTDESNLEVQDDNIEIPEFEPQSEIIDTELEGTNLDEPSLDVADDLDAPELAAELSEPADDLDVPELAAESSEQADDLDVPELAAELSEQADDLDVPELAAEQSEPADDQGLDFESITVPDDIAETAEIISTDDNLEGSESLDLSLDDEPEMDESSQSHNVSDAAAEELTEEFGESLDELNQLVSENSTEPVSELQAQQSDLPSAEPVDDLDALMAEFDVHPESVSTSSPVVESDLPQASIDESQIQIDESLELPSDLDASFEGDQMTVDEALAALDVDNDSQQPIPEIEEPAGIEDSALAEFQKENGFIDIDKLLNEADEQASEVEPYKDVDIDLGFDQGMDDLMDDKSMVDVDDAENAINAKLDLARAYIEIEDKDSAKALLQEVQTEGNERQQGEAQELIDSL